MRAQDRATPVARRRVVLGAIAVLSAVAALGALVLAGMQPQEPAKKVIPWVVLTLLFGAAEIVVLHIQIRREAQSVSLSEVPFVLGLVFLGPWEFLAARLLGPFVVFVVYRRQPVDKTAFNVALQAAGATTGLLAFYAIAGAQQFPSAAVLVALLVAVAVATVLEVAALEILVGIYDGALDARRIVREALTSPLLAVLVADFGIVAAYALTLEPWSGAFMLGCALLLLLVYRTFANLQERHLGLQRLYHFSQTVTAATDADAVLRHVLEEVHQIARADLAVIHLVDLEQPEASRRSVLDAGGRLTTDRAGDGTTAVLDHPLVWHHVIDQGVPLLLRRGERDPARRAVLDAYGLRDALVVPLKGDESVLGALVVIDRQGEVRGFDHDDQLLLETAAAHTATALRNGRLLDQLRHEAAHDALTGLPNRAHFQRATEEALQHAESGDARGRHRTAVMIMDLDGFKEVNDTLGHTQGDLVLREVATRLEAASEGAAQVARIGGDEFAILVDRAFDLEYAMAVARRLLATLERPIALEGLDVALSGSLGIAMSPEHGSNVADLLKRADVAMYAAKSDAAGIAVYEARQDTRSPQRLALVGDMRRALDNSQLDVHVQPKARIATGAVQGVEALARWHGSELCAVPPEEFIPIAERSGLISELTRRVLDVGLEAVSLWLAQGHTLSLAVNLSPRSLLDPDLVTDVRSQLQWHGVPPSLLTLEITESSVMADPPRTIGTLHALRDLGLRLSVDDFGTGYSSLSYLKRLPVNEVKIDKSFVQTMDRDADNASIVRSIVDLGANLGLRVVAEGVESIEIWRQLGELGCEVAQGYLLSRPMPIDDLPQWLETYDGGVLLGLAPSAQPTHRIDPVLRTDPAITRHRAVP